MDNQQSTNQLNQVSHQEVPQKTSPIILFSQKVEKILVRIKSIFVRSSNSSLPSQSQSALLESQAVPQAVNSSTLSYLPKTTKAQVPKKKLLVILLGGVFVIVALVIAMSFGRKKDKFSVILSPSPSPTPTPSIDLPSQYADDEDIRKIKEAIEILNQKINEPDFKNEKLRIPTLDWEVKFR